MHPVQKVSLEPCSGQDLASSAGALEVVGMAHTGPRAVIDGLPAEVQKTSARATLRVYVAPSANELAWFYMGFRLGHAVGVPDA